MPSPRVCLDAAVSVLPLLACELDVHAQGVQQESGQSGGQLGEDAVAELVARPRERERGVRVQALQAAAARRAADAGVELGPDAALLGLRVGEAARELRVLPAARDQRSTPPAASSREIAATRCLHVT